MFLCRAGFNARVLGEGRIALSKKSLPLLEEAGIAFRLAAGGVVARILPSDLTALATLDGDLVKAIEAALAGWAKREYTWVLKGGRRMRLGPRPCVMGVLNVTPDSFSDGGLHLSFDAAVKQALTLLEAGAAIIDIGGESTRPGAQPVEETLEIERTAPVVREVFERTGAVISIDTTKAAVAAAALDAGAAIINDISGLAFDREMAALAAETGAGLVVMHIRGKPDHMQDDPSYDDTLAEVAQELRERVLFAADAGIKPERIVLDPGIGFGKRFEDNLRIVAGLEELRSLGFPLLLGCSRKSFLGRISGREPQERALETAATSVLAAAAGVQIVRVHDVEENVRALKVAEAVLDARRRE